MPPSFKLAQASRRVWFATVGLLLGIAGLAGAQETNNAPDKSGFNLFNPVPHELMRELTPDRPDKTESPYTVDAGHFQLEMDFANFTQDETDGTRTRAWNVAPINLKAGLLNRVDVQFIFDNYLNVRTEDRTTGAKTTQSGVGDLTTRLKVNLWGDDGGPTAFGLLPYVKFPTATGQLGNNGVEGGIILPLAMKLPWEFELGTEAAVSYLRNSNDSGYHEEFIGSITLDHDIIGNLGGYVEFFANPSTEPHSSWVGTVDLGLEYKVTEDIQLDAGANIGVTPAADDLNLYSGITVRF